MKLILQLPHSRARKWSAHVAMVVAGVFVLLAGFAMLSVPSTAKAAATDPAAETELTPNQKKFLEAAANLRELEAEKAAPVNADPSAVGPEPDANGNYPSGAFAAALEAPDDEYSLGVIEKITQAETEAGGLSETSKDFSVRLTSGNEKGKTVSVKENDLDVTRQSRPLNVGDRVVVVKSWVNGDTAHYYIADNYRLPSLLLMTLIFFGSAVLFARKRGLTSVAGLAATVGVIIWYVIPRVAAGADPLKTSLIAAFVIAASSLYLAHGFNVRTTIAFVSTCLTLGFSAWMAVVFVKWSHLFGMGSETVMFLQGSGFGDIDLRGLLLGGIILGVLGILDDITTAQAAIVEELKRANPRYTFRELYRRGLSVGKEHIASLINTLFLAYAGASLPLFLLFSANRSQPFWFVLNSESIAEEIVRTLVGSICLILAVPITTALAASLYSERMPAPEKGDEGHVHHH